MKNQCSININGLTNRAPKKRRYERTSLHIAAAYNQKESIKFLLDPQTVQISKKVLQNLNEKHHADILSNFDLTSVDGSKRTAFHYAVGNHSLEALSQLISFQKHKSGDII